MIFQQPHILWQMAETEKITGFSAEKDKNVPTLEVNFSKGTNLKKQVKSGFTNYQPRGLDKQINFEV